MPNTDETLPTPPADPNATLARPTDAPPGALAIPGYDLQPEIARGGMGVVYAARDRAFDREVAIKVMLPGMDAAAFLREARITGRLPHPGIPPVYALGELPDGRPYLAMKLIRGDTLDKVLKARTDLSADRGKLLAAFEQMCHAVGYAHAQGLIHRDLKPSNIMVGAFGEVQVMDWGLAKEVRSAELGTRSEEPASSAVPSSALHDPRFQETLAGVVKGTPAYMAPEQARGEPVDARADVFALGGILAAILTNHPPFAGNSVYDTIIRAAQAELSETFARLSASGADTDLLTLCKKSLAANAEERFTDATELAHAVAAYRAEVEARLLRAERERAAAEERRKRRRAQWALAASVLLLVVAGGVGAAFASLWRTSEGNREAAESQRDTANVAKYEALGQKKIADNAKEEALTAKGVAEEARAAEAAARKQVEFEREKLAATEYARTIEVAQRECRDGNFKRARELYESTRLALRGWEYHYVHRLTDGGCLLSIRNGRPIWSHPAVSFSPDGRYLLTIGDETYIRDARTGERIRELKNNSNTYGGIYSGQFSPDGKYIITASPLIINIWNAGTGNIFHSLPGFQRGDTERVFFSGDSKKAIAFGKVEFGRNLVCLCWDTETGNRTDPDEADRVPQKTVTEHLKGHKAKILATAVSPDGTKMVTGSEDHTAKIWDAATGNECASFIGHTKPVTSVAYSHDGNRIVSASEDGTVKIWDARASLTGRAVTGEASITSVTFYPDGNRILTGASNGVVAAWDTKLGKQVRTFDRYAEAVGSVAYSRDGKYFVTADLDKDARVYDSTSGQLIRKLNGHLFGTYSASFSAKGDYILTCGVNIARLWDTGTGAVVRDFEGHSNNVRTGQISPDGARVITGSDDRTARIWDARTGKELRQLSGHTKTVTSVTFNRTGAHVVTASEDNTAKVWDSITGKELLALKGHTGSVRAVAYSPDDSRVATASDDGTAIVWDIKTGVAVITLKGHTAALTSIAFSADGKQIVTGSKDKSARIWDARSDKELLDWLTPPPLAVAPPPRAK